MADRLLHTEDAGGSSPSSSTVAEAEVVETPGRGPGGSRFESGRSPQSGRSGISGVSYALTRRVRFPLPQPSPSGSVRGPWASCDRKRRLPCKEMAAGSTPAWSTSADVAQRKRHGAQTAVSVGSNPTVSTTWTWRNGSAPASGAGGWRFESSRPDQCEVVPMRGGGTGTTPGPEPGGPRSNRGLAAIDASSVVSVLTVESACCAGGGSFTSDREVAGSNPAVASAT